MQESEKSEVAQLCLTLRDPKDCNLTGSSIHGVFQARVLEWVAISEQYGGSLKNENYNYLMTQQSHYRAFTLRKP